MNAIVEELERLRVGLENSQTMVVRESTDGLKCSFIKHGLVQDDFMVKDEVVADVLSESGLTGIVEGKSFEKLRSNYGWFSVRVKSRKLLKELQ
ncbi:hypothetical protein WG947_09690 [Pontibacter sp. H259]|uniref:hypothetical protein n=1 Tax=Pontibacter sp. H259 TaxID=3133421 RepID=UPI0030BC57DF